MDPRIEQFPRDVSIWHALAVVQRRSARAGHNEIDRGRIFPPEVFDDFTFWIGLEGRSTVELMGRTHPLNVGMCLLLPPQVSAAQTIAADADYRIAYFHFDIAYHGKVLRDARRYVREGPDTPMALALPGLPSLALFALLDTERLAERLLQTVRRWDDVSQLQSQSLIIGALAEHRREMVRPKSGRGRGVSIVDSALQYLVDNLHRPVFVEDVASHLRLSQTHLTRVFRAQLHETPMQALARIRLTHAQNLLRDPALNIGEVAEACGFESLSFFTRVFSRKYGSPPSTYRRGLQVCDRRPLAKLLPMK